MSNKLPAIQFYPADWRKDIGVQSLSYHDRGVWLEILCLMHESEERGKLILNGQPMSSESLARILGLDKQRLEQTLETLLTCGVASRDENGVLFNRRMVKDEYIRSVRKIAGKKGGNPNLLNQNSNQNPTKTKTKVKQNSTPSSSFSSSPSGKKDISLERDISKKIPRNGSLSPPYTLIPKNFFISDELRLWAKDEGITVDLEFETKKFKNHYESASGHKALSADWVKTWKNWILRGQAYADRQPSSPADKPNPGKGETFKKPLPEEIERQKKEEELFQNNLEICPNCGKESSLDFFDCEICGEEKYPL